MYFFSVEFWHRIMGAVSQGDETVSRSGQPGHQTVPQERGQIGKTQSFTARSVSHNLLGAKHKMTLLLEQ